MEIEQLFTLQTLILSLGSFAIVKILRSIIEFKFAKNRFYTAVILPSLSLVTGSILGYFIATVLNGLIAGLLSTLIYNRVTSFIEKPKL